jgi:hypothetical protein
MDPFTVAWAAYNKGDEAPTIGEHAIDAGEYHQSIVDAGGAFVVVDMADGEIVGAHARQEDAEEQARDPEGKFAAGGGGGKGGGEKPKASKGAKAKSVAKTLGTQFAKNLYAVQKATVVGGARKGVVGAVLGGASAALSAIPATIKAGLKAHRTIKGDGQRYQRQSRMDLAPAQRLPNGWLRVEGRSARVGILEYDNPDGSVRRELVLPEDLFDEASLATARMVPVTSPHPQALLDDKTARAHQVGSVGENLRRDGDYLVTPLMITDGGTVMAIESGRQELSWGYDCELDPADPSLFEKWGQHDVIQRDRVYNHLACVDSARAGAGARMRLDASGHQQGFARDPDPVLSNDPQPLPPRRNQMPIRIAGHSYETTDPALQGVIDRVLAEARLDGEKAAKAEKERADAAQAVAARLKKHAVQRGGYVIKLQGHLDAMKAKAVGCDECAGSGKVDDGAGGMAKCDYCDGSGSFRMHDAIKAMAPAPGEEPAADEGEPPAPKMTDDAALERDDPEEEQAEKEANAGHKDAARKAVVALRGKRTDMLQRLVARGARARASLLVEAAAILGADAKLDGKSTEAIKREVVAKAAPHVKLDGLDAKGVDLMYAAEIARLAKAREDGGRSASDNLRAGLLPTGSPPTSTAGRTKEVQARIDEANEAKYNTREYLAKKQKGNGTA